MSTRRTPAPPRDRRSDPLRRLLGLPEEGQVRKRRPRRREHARAGGREDLAQVRRSGWRGWIGVAGPGVVTGAADDDPSGIGTFTQAGAQFGYGFLWTALFTLPLMYAVQEACQRVALQTGEGLGVALAKRFPRRLIVVVMGAVAIANIITLGADLGGIAAAASLLTGGFLRADWVLGPIAAGILVVQIAGSYRVLFSIFKWLTLALFAYIVAGILAHPHWGAVLLGTIRPSLQVSSGSVTMLIALLGTTISPYLFIWQASSEVDAMKAAGAVRLRDRRGISDAGLAAGRLDVGLGMLISQVVMYFAILTSAAALAAHGHHDVQSAEQAAAALGPIGGTPARILFCLGIIGTGLLAVPVLSGSTAYAFKEVFPGLPGTLADRFFMRPTFYAIIVAATLIGVAINYLHVNVIQALVIASAVNGAVAGPLLFLILAVASDARIMGGRRLGRVGRFGLGAAASVMTVAALAWLLAGAVLPRFGWSG